MLGPFFPGSFPCPLSSPAASRGAFGRTFFPDADGAGGLPHVLAPKTGQHVRSPPSKKKNLPFGNQALWGCGAGERPIRAQTRKPALETRGRLAGSFKKPTSSASVIGVAAQWVSLCEVMPTQDGTPPDLFLCLAPASAGTHNEQGGRQLWRCY